VLSPKHLLAAATLVFLGVWFLLFRPAFLGGPTSYVIVSGNSMEPTIYTGYLALVLKQGSYSVGDVVAFRVAGGETRGSRVPEGGGIIIHRIIGGNDAEGYRMQGDNNDWVDPWRPTGDEIVGKAIGFVPRLGGLFNYLQDPLRLALAVGAFSIYISLAGFFLTKPVGRTRERRRMLRMRQARRRGGLASWLPA